MRWFRVMSGWEKFIALLMVGLVAVLVVSVLFFTKQECSYEITRHTAQLLGCHYVPIWRPSGVVKP